MFTNPSLPIPKLYNTGFLLNDKNSRIKQGLFPQTIANDCFVDMNNNVKQNLLKNPYYNNTVYPLKMPFVTYGTENSVPNNCDCLQNIRAL